MGTQPRFVFDDGGRAEAGYKGLTGDCVTRAIAIATGLPYREVYEEMARRLKVAHTAKVARIMARGGLTPTGKRASTSPRDGVPRSVYEKYLMELGWRWKATMRVGVGCKVHLTREELPNAVIICRLSHHLTVMQEGVIHDTHDPSRQGTRCVYGYFYRAGRE